MSDRRLDRFLLGAVLFLSLALNLTSIGYQQPRHWDPAVDGVHPTLAQDAWENLFGERHVVSLKYPRAHVALMGAWERAWLTLRFGVDGSAARRTALMELYRASAPAPTADAREALRTHTETISEMILAGRVLSALFGTLAVFGLFFLTRELFGRAAAGLVGMAAAVQYPLVYYAHTLNVDAPYLGWSMVALALVARAVRTGSVRTVLFAVLAAALAGATKDQAFGLFLLATPAVLFLLARPGGLADPERRPVRARGVLLAGLAGALLYLLLLGLPFDPAGVRTHFEHIFGEGVTPFRTHPATLAGVFGLAHESLLHLADMLGVPWLALSIAGALWMTVRAPRKSALVVLPAFAYYVTFIAPIGYVYMRFLLPVALLALVPAAALAVELARVKGLRLVVALVMLGSLVPRMQQSVQLVELLPRDPRIEASAWLAEHVADGESLLALLEIPMHNIELPTGAVVHRVAAQDPRAPELEAPVDWYVVSTFDTHRSAAAPTPPPPAPPASTVVFGVAYDRVAVFAPAGAHVIRRGATFQPTIGVYRRRE